MTINYALVIGLDYGCEVDPVLNVLRKAFPGVVFEAKRSGLSSSWDIRVDAVTAEELATYRIVACACRDGFTAGWKAAEKEYAR